MTLTGALIVVVGLLRTLGYIDPGSGSLLIQLLLGGIAGGWVMLKLFGRRIGEFLGLAKKEKAGDDGGPTNA